MNTSEMIKIVWNIRIHMLVYVYIVGI